MNRRIPIVADAYVDPKFGTGAVKITPAHDPNDYELGQRHNLPNLTVIDEDGKMAKEAGAYAGMERFACRKKVLEDMEAQGRLVKVEDLNHAVGHCSRCSTVVEPLLSKQWYVRMEPLARPAIAAVKEGRIQFVPDRFAKLYLNWVENVHDWCISRQLWWGHRIPVWYCKDCGEIIAAVEEPKKCPKCGTVPDKKPPTEGTGEGGGQAS
jgi:valyl-tRNA synthetase